jgi:uncharacterized membrane protein YfhO
MFNGTKPLRHIVIERQPGIKIDPSATGSAAIVRYTPNTITINANATAPALLFLSDTYSRMFSATVDGKPAEILRADYSYRAVAIPQGNHTVVMSYRLTPWIIGTTVSGILWITGGLMGVVLVRKKIFYF